MLWISNGMRDSYNAKRETEEKRREEKINAISVLYFKKIILVVWLGFRDF